VKEYEVYETYKKEEPVFYFLYEDNLFQLISQPLSGSSSCLSCLCLLICLRYSCLFGKRKEKKKKEEEEEGERKGKRRYEEEKKEKGHKNPLAIAASCSASFPRFCTIV